MFSYQTKSKTILADLYTPVSAYLRVRDSYPQSALMESSDYHGGENSRSFIGFNPLASISISHGKAISKMPDGSTIEKAISESYRVDLAINDFLHQIKVTGDDSNFCGLYGYTSFNAVRYLKTLPSRMPPWPKMMRQICSTFCIRRSSCSTISTIR
jgi:anthranilate synthase component 1